MSEIDYCDVKQVAKATRKHIAAWKAARKALRRASAARAAVQGASRARLTTANARYMSASENFDKHDAFLREWAETVDPVDIDALKNEPCAHDFYYGKCVLCDETGGVSQSPGGEHG